MNGEPPKTDPVPGEVPEDDGNAVPRSGSGAGTALLAMLRKRQMRAGAEPQAPLPDGGKPRGN
jgi:hypothetical protein